jgi:FkbM family methyltransferase
LRDNSFQKRSIVLDGHSFVVYGLDDDHEYFGHLTDDFEPEYLEVCCMLIAEDAICMDIGANIGVKSLSLARQITRGRVVSVEAGPRIVGCLKANVEANDLKNVDVLHAAIGDQSGEVKFAEHSAFGFVSDKGASVQMMTISDAVGHFSLPRLDFIKIDVEGHEFKILRNSLDVINRFRSLVMLEFNSWYHIVHDESPKKFMEWLLQNFAYVLALRKSPDSGELLRRVNRDNMLDVLRENVMRHGCVSDLLVTNSAERLNPPPRWPSERLREAASKLAVAERERDQALADLAAVKTSTSWRITAPMRSIMRVLRR